MIDHAPHLSTTELTALLGAHELLKSENTALKQHLAALQRRVEWFERQFFGAKSERRIVEDGAYQMSLGEIFDVTVDTGVPETKTIAAHKRQIPRKSPLDGAVCDTGLRFGPQVPVEEIRLEPAEIAGLSPDAYEIIDEKVTHKLAQEAASYVVIKIIQPVVKLKDSGALVSAPAPPAVLEKSYADVSFIAGMAVDKFLYHPPLYRQHQKLERNGIVLARGTLTTTMQRAIGLLEPIYTAVFCSVLQSLILAMDETPAKAGRAGGKMKTGYFWPIYGDQDEVVFPFFDNRRHENVDKLLKDYTGTLISDGYAAYERFTARQNSPGEPGKAPVIHAHCWVHLRRMFLKAEKEHPDRVKRALEFIRVLYRHDEAHHDDPPEFRHAARQHHSAPVGGGFFCLAGTGAVRARPLTERSIHPSDELRLATPRQLRGVPLATERRLGYPPRGARASGDSDGSKELEFLLDRTGRQTRGHHSKLIDHV